MDHPSRLPLHELRPDCDLADLDFGTTDDLADLVEIVGQKRATSAIRFGIDIRHDGYNIFALGSAGTGRQTVVRQYLEAQAKAGAVPADWCYVHDLRHGQRPRALRLPAGRGAALRDAMDRLVGDLESAIPAAFESEEYRARRQAMDDEPNAPREAAFEALRQKAEAASIAMVRAPAGIGFAPMKDGEVMERAEHERLPQAERDRLAREVEALQDELIAVLRHFHVRRRQAELEIRTLDQEVTRSAVGLLMIDVRAEFADLPDVMDHLQQVEQSIVEHRGDFLREDDDSDDEPASGSSVGGLTDASVTGERSRSTSRYRVNLVVDHANTVGAPVVYEDNPTFPNLVGRVEHLSQMGTLVTDFTLIRPGTLHRANGGYLIIDALKLLTYPYAWDGLKQALRSREIRIESPGHALAEVSTITLEPEAIPLDLKVVLVGERTVYYALHELDGDFRELFKVAADFEESIRREGNGDLLYARLIATLVRRERLLPFDKRAVARVFAEGARCAEDRQRLSLRSCDLVDLLREADYWARGHGRPAVSPADVDQAVEARRYRTGRPRDELREEIVRGTLLIDTDGEATGAVNGLAVVDAGDASIGHPIRITARVRLGKRGGVDIQREARLGGPVHTKGVMILASYLSTHYAPDSPLALTATLAFEQTYGMVEGDSSSCAELYALLSALANVPIRQTLAVTGSVNQLGQVQAIGGVNEKIAGYFELCQARGLSGKHGVVIPCANVRHLALGADVVRAVETGQFHVYAVSTIDQGLELLTGRPAGTRDARGAFPTGTVNHAVETRLVALGEAARRDASAPARRRGRK